MSSSAIKNNLQEIINVHAVKARNSQYDRDVCILTISAAREAIMLIPDNIPSDDYKKRALNNLDELFRSYHDPDGMHTSGRGVIGALIDDVRASIGK